MSHYQLLGNIETATPETYSYDDMKDVSAYTHVRTGVSPDINKWYSRTPGTAYYFMSPYNWVDLPRNHLESKGRIKEFQNRFGNSGIDWIGRAFHFKDPNKYINTLKVVDTPEAYIEFLKLAPLAGFNITSDLPVTCASRGVKESGPYKGKYCYKLPPEATFDWWLEVLTYTLLKKSFTELRMAQIEDLPDLEKAYANAEKLKNKLRGAFRNDIPVDVLPINNLSTGFRVSVGLEEWQITELENCLYNFRGLIEGTKAKMARRIVELKNVNATIDPTPFSVDPYRNPYLVYSQERSQEEGKPIFTNIARNDAQFSPPEVAGRPENMEYWKQVPDYIAEHERIYATKFGPMSESDIIRHGLDKDGRVNWLPWIVAGGAAAFAATQVL